MSKDDKKNQDDLTIVIDTTEDCVMQNDFKCCPPLPHYSKIISDGNFVARNIALTDMSDSPWNPLTDINSTYAGGCCNQYSAAYPGGSAQLSKDEEDTMGPCEKTEFERQEDVARRWKYDNYFWQDLNQGRQYARGLSDNLDETIAERNNFTSGWYNGKEGMLPGDAPYRNPYCENHPPYNPYEYRKPLVNMRTFGSRSYKWDTIYQQGRYPDQFCRSGQYNDQLVNPRCDKGRCYMDYGEEYR